MTTSPLISVSDFKIQLTSHYNTELATNTNVFRATAIKKAINLIESIPNDCLDWQTYLSGKFSKTSSILQYITARLAEVKLTATVVKKIAANKEWLKAARHFSPCLKDMPSSELMTYLSEDITKCSGWGPATAKRYIPDDKEINTVGEMLLHCKTNGSESIPATMMSNLIHHAELCVPLNRSTVEEVWKLLGKGVLTVVGSYRRSKMLTKDVDILFTPPNNFSYTCLDTKKSVKYDENKDFYNVIESILKHKDPSFWTHDKLKVSDYLSIGNDRISILCYLPESYDRKYCIHIDFFRAAIGTIGPAFYHHTGPFSYNIKFRKEAKANIIKMIKEKGATQEDIDYVTDNLKVSQHGISIRQWLYDKFSIDFEYEKQIPFTEMESLPEARERAFSESLNIPYVEPSDRT